MKQARLKVTVTLFNSFGLAQCKIEKGEEFLVDPKFNVGVLEDEIFKIHPDEYELITRKGKPDAKRDKDD